MNDAKKLAARFEELEVSSSTLAAARSTVMAREALRASI